MPEVLIARKYEDMPATLPVFPLAGALLLPGGRLPLNIFEPRYLAMTLDALGADRLIGMIQPSGEAAAGGEPALYAIGCAGRIVQFSETEDGRFLITLAGVSRFSLVRELEGVHGYRRVEPAWDRFLDDFTPDADAGIDRAALTGRLKRYFDAQGITADWDAIRETPDDRLVTTLAMICPFQPSEKQALLEAGSLRDRAGMLEALLDMASVAETGNDHARH